MLLSRKTFAMADFGSLAPPLCRLLLSLVDPEGAFLLKDKPFVKCLIDQWVAFRGTNSPADAGEFTQFLLGSLTDAATQNQLHWERRAMIEGNFTTMDQTSHNAPTVLQFHPSHVHISQVALQALTHEWQTYKLMHSAFTSTPAMMCLQVERQVQIAGELLKCNTEIQMDGEIFIPFFTDPHSTAFSMKAFIVVAALVHEGDMEQRHYQCLLRTRMHPDEWALKDDNASIVWHDAIPSWFASQTQLIWLIPRDEWHPMAEDIIDEDDMVA